MPRPALIAGAFATVALVIVAGGCGFKSEPTGALSPAPVTVTDAEGTTIALDAVPKRIVSLDPGMTELLFEIGAGDSVVARSAGDAYPAAAADVPVVSARPAAVRRYKPDLVIADEHSAQELRAGLKVPVYAVDGTTITGAERDQLKVGLLAGRGPQGRTVAERVRRGIARTRAATGPLMPAKVYLDQGAFVPPGKLASQLIAAAGGLAVTAASPGSSSAPLRRCTCPSRAVGLTPRRCAPIPRPKRCRPRLGDGCGRFRCGG